MKRVGVLISVAALLAGGFMICTGTAQPVRRELLKELRIADVRGCQVITTELQFPIALQDYTPVHRGALLMVRVMPLQAPEVAFDARASREALVPDGERVTPLDEVSTERGAGRDLRLVFRFNRTVSYDISSGKDFRSVILTLRPDTEDPAPCRNSGAVLP